MNQEFISNSVRNSYAILSLMVLFYHSGANDPDFILNVPWISTFIDSIRIPLYFFIGGVLTELQFYRLGAIEVFKKRFKRLMIPYSWFPIFYFLIESKFSNSEFRRPKSLLFSILYPSYHLWFLPAFFLASIIGLLQIRYLKSLLLNFVFVFFTMALSSTLKNNDDGLFAFKASIILLPFFCFGIFFSKALFQKNAKFPLKYVYFMFLMVLFFVILQYRIIDKIPILLVLPLIFLSAGFFTLENRLRLLSDLTFQIYLLSPLGIGFSRYVLNLYGRIGATPEVFLNAICGLFSTLIIVWFFKKTKFTSFLIGLKFF